MSWLKQTDKPLFPDLLWDKPENKQLAGKLLIIGGNTHGFAAPADAYQAAQQAGAGAVKVLLPEGLRHTIGAILENTEYAPSNKSGSFARNALGEWITWANWADATLIAGDVGRNSETGIVLESFLTKHGGLLTITKDALDYFLESPRLLLDRKQTLVIASFAQLQKLLSKQAIVLQFSMTTPQIVEALKEASADIAAHIITEHNGIFFVAVDGKVSTTKKDIPKTWRVATAASATVWWLQNPNKPFEALTTSVFID